jgi:hypothetical protein
MIKHSLNVCGQETSAARTVLANSRNIVDLLL